MLSDWFVWDSGFALLFVIFGIGVWLVSSSEEVGGRVKRPKLLGFGVSLLSCIELGLGGVVSGFLFLLFSYVLEFWLFRLRNRKV